MTASRRRFSEDYPDIKIVAEQGIGGPDFSGDAEKAAGAILTAHPKINAIWAVWDVPAEGVMSAARAAGRDDLIIVNEDLGENVAIAMAKGEFIKGIASQRPYDQGVTEAKLAAYALIGKPAPAYVALPAAPITRDTLLDELEGDLPPAADRQDQGEHEVTAEASSASRAARPMRPPARRPPLTQDVMSRCPSPPKAPRPADDCGAHDRRLQDNSAACARSTT